MNKVMTYKGLGRVRAQLAALVLLILISGCERSTEVSFFIDNTSSHEVLVRGTDVFLGQAIVINILPGEKQQVSQMHFWGIREEPIMPTESLGTDLSIANAQGDTLLRDYRLSDCWSSQWLDHRWTATRTYSLTLEEGDFAH